MTSDYSSELSVLRSDLQGVKKEMADLKRFTRDLMR